MPYYSPVELPRYLLFSYHLSIFSSNHLSKANCSHILVDYRLIVFRLKLIISLYLALMNLIVKKCKNKPNNCCDSHSLFILLSDRTKKTSGLKVLSLFFLKSIVIYLISAKYFNKPVGSALILVLVTLSVRS